MLSAPRRVKGAVESGLEKAEFRLSRLGPWAGIALGTAIIVVMMIPLAWPYLKPGLQLGHDRTIPYFRVLALKGAIQSGQIPPRWFPTFDGGYGSPYPSFYGMLFYYVAALIDTCCTSVGPAVEATVLLTLFVSALGMFLLARHLWGTASGVLSAGLYLYAPYHLVDTYVRGAYSELSAFMWFPLVLLFMVLWRDRPRRAWILGGGLSLASLVITHNIMPMVFLPALPVLALALAGHELITKPRHGPLAGWLAMALVGALLSAYFWMPILLDRHLIQTQYFLQVNYRDEFVGLSQLLGTTLTHSLTHEIGVPLLLTATAAITASFTTKRLKSTHGLLLAAIGMTLVYAFFMNYRSGFLWATIPLLPFVQLPWRLLAPTTFLFALTAGALPAALTSRRWPWLMAIVIPLLALQVHHPLVRIPKRISPSALAELSTCQDVWGTQDYRPVWSEAAFWISTKAPSAKPKTPLLPPCPGMVTIKPSGVGDTTAVRQSGLTWTFDLALAEPAVIRLSQFYYPTWRASVDGQAAQISPEPQTGLIQVGVPGGDHTLQITLGRTFAQTWGAILSTLGLVVTLLAGIWPTTSKRPGPDPGQRGAGAG